MFICIFYNIFTAYLALVYWISAGFLSSIIIGILLLFNVLCEKNRFEIFLCQANNIIRHTLSSVFVLIIILMDIHYKLL